MLAPAFEAALEPETRPHLDLLMAARDLWPGLAARLGLSLNLDGALALGDAAWLDAMEAAFRDLGVKATRQGGRAVRHRAPEARAELRSGLLVLEDWQVDARRAISALRREALAAGVAMEARPLSLSEADLVVVATGPGQGLVRLAPDLAVLTPIKGHLLRAPGRLRGVVRGQGVYGVPAGEDEMIVGATMEVGLDDPAVDAARAAALQAEAARLFPGLKGARATPFAGVRAATPDGLPLVGPGRREGVMLAAGARRNGWLLAPLVARTIVALVEGRDPGPWAGRMDPRRFGEAAP
jgi:glycine oxidase